MEDLFPLLRHHRIIDGVSEDETVVPQTTQTTTPIIAPQLTHQSYGTAIYCLNDIGYKVPKQTAEGPRRRLIYRNHHPLLLSLLLTVFLNTGSAFIQLPIHAYAMSDTAYSGSGNSAKPLSAQLEGDNNNNESEASSNGAEETLLLPESSGDPSIPSIKLGESIRFEDMGPIIINSDGSTRQIDNWDKMTKSEQEVAWRRISKRNEQRRKALLEKQEEEQEEEEKGKN